MKIIQRRRAGTTGWFDGPPDSDPFLYETRVITVVTPVAWRYHAVGNNTGWQYTETEPPSQWGGAELIIEPLYTN